MSTSKMTFSLASLVILIALGLVFVATPAMAAMLASTPTVGDQMWVQGQQEISITFPMATAETNEDTLAVTISFNGTDVSVGGDGTISSGGALNGFVLALTETTADDAKNTVVGKLTGNASVTEVPRGVFVYTVTETPIAPTDGVAPTLTNPTVGVTFTAQVNRAPDLMFQADASIPDMVLTAGDPIPAMVLPEAEGGVAPLTYIIVGATVISGTPEDRDRVYGGGTSNLPAGITFAEATRQLSGSPSAAVSRAVVTYRVTDSATDRGPANNAADTQDLTFTVEVKARPTGPAFDLAGDKVADAAYTKDHAITANTLPEADATYATAPLTYALAPVPKGLSFAAGTRMLTGTPTEAAVTDAMYTVTDAAGMTDSVMFKITVNGVVTVTDVTNQSGDLGKSTSEIDITLTSSGGTGDKTYTVSGLPDGVMFDNKTKIAGTPSRSAAASTEVTVTATDSLGASGSAKFTITVTKPKPLAFSQTGFTDAIAPRVFTDGQAIAPTVLPAGADGVEPYTYDLEDVPAGLNFDANTRLLSGTPTDEQDATDHTYTITDSAFAHVESPNQNQTPSSITLPISITVNAATVVDNNAPDFGDKTIARLDAMEDQAITGRILPEASDEDSDAELTYTLEGKDGEDLPDGLEFDDETRSLTGTPTEGMDETLYIYTAEDQHGASDTISFFISVRASAPVTGTGTPAANIPAKGYVVYVRSLADAPNFGTLNPMVAEWSAMPDLNRLFTVGGKLEVSVTGATNPTGRYQRSYVGC